ncbi:hypothetical protein Poly24_16370 [Rosistilla carotiformis]|uniref:Uncharacterized protein n=1 Tax=Rosistilla carotiformis TaxID=2528017 RepID=A0A518JQV8_9BACT|nr:efflux RND transporter permease subunit [Rosistilla carotiformis]QDV67931.1 hypothetical protein Poly24_16370 [Rosistilla carotiformis]
MDETSCCPGNDASISGGGIGFFERYLTFWVGLLPLTPERSTQAQVLIPTAVSIVFGLFASTILLLIVVPCLYVVLCDLGWIQPDEHPRRLRINRPTMAPAHLRPKSNFT